MADRPASNTYPRYLDRLSASAEGLQDAAGYIGTTWIPAVGALVPPELRLQT